jgi:arylsulfatase A
MCTTDLMATFSGLLNTPLPNNSAEDSYNFWPVFTGRSSSSPVREATIHHSEKGFFSIRKGQWKYTPHLGSGGFSIPMKETAKEGEAPGTLYNMNDDPGEQHNLYNKYPALVKELDYLLKDYIQRGQTRKI